jgi:hypothetical protein
MKRPGSNETKFRSLRIVWGAICLLVCLLMSVSQLFGIVLAVRIYWAAPIIPPLSRMILYGVMTLVWLASAIVGSVFSYRYLLRHSRDHLTLRSS